MNRTFDALTPKQLAVVLAAHDLGLYETPRRANLDALAERFGISKAAVHNRLVIAERKIIGDFVAAARAGDAARASELERLTRERLARVAPEGP